MIIKSIHIENEENLEIDISDLEQGVYLLHVYTRNGEMFYSKVIKE